MEGGDLLNSAQVVCFKFHAIGIIIPASQGFAFQTGLYSLASVRNTFRGIEEGGGWRRREMNIKDKAEERGDRDQYIWVEYFWHNIELWSKRLDQLPRM